MGPDLPPTTTVASEPLPLGWRALRLLAAVLAVIAIYEAPLGQSGPTAAPLVATTRG